MDNRKHELAVENWSRQATVRIDFREAKSAVLAVIASPHVPGTFFCLKDVEDLELAAKIIRDKLEDAKRHL